MMNGVYFANATDFPRKSITNRMVIIMPVTKEKTIVFMYKLILLNDEDSEGEEPIVRCKIGLGKWFDTLNADNIP